MTAARTMPVMLADPTMPRSKGAPTVFSAARTVTDLDLAAVFGLARAV